MAKRFIETTLWDDPWFRALPLRYKLLWIYVWNRSDAAGIWKVDVDAASFFIGEKVEISKALELFNEEKCRVAPLNGSGKWLVVQFIDFQYGKLSEACPPHRKVFEILNLHKLTLPFAYPNVYPSARVQDKEEDKVKEEVKEVFAVLPEFEKVWLKYPRRLGRKDAFRHFKATVQSAEDLLKINKALDRYLQHIAGKDPNFIKHGSSWFNNWKDWLDFNDKAVTSLKPQVLKECFVCHKKLPEPEYSSHFSGHEKERDERQPGEVGSLVKDLAAKLGANQGETKK